MADVVSIELYKEADFDLAGLRVQPSLNRVERAGTVVRLEPKIMKVLVVLWRTGGAVVSRDDLIHEVWEGQIVTTDAITRCISRLRKLFAEDFETAVEIETVQKTGYRLVVPEQEAQPGRHDKRKTLVGGVLVTGVLVLAYLLYPREELAHLRDLFSGPVRPLTSFPGKERYPVFSPDGHYLLFSWQPEEGDVYDLYRMDVASNDLLKLTSGDGHKVRGVWSPDGTRVAYYQTDANGCSIVLQPSIGGAPRRIANCPAGNALALDWAPDGGALLAGWRARPWDRGELFVIDLESHELQRVPVEGDFPLGVDDAFYSLDGRHIGVSLSTTLGVEDLYLLPAQGGVPQRLTWRNLKIHDFKFVPGADAILAATNWLGTFGLWVVPLDGAEPYPVGNLTSGVDGVGLSAEGRVAIEVWDESAGVWRLDLRDRSLSRLGLNSTRFDWDAQISPDGARMALISDRSGSAEVWVADRETGTLSRLSDFGGPWTHSPRWSPDGDRLVFASPVAGHFDLFLADPASGRLEQLTHDQGNNFAPAWAPDGRYVYFGSDRGRGWQIWRMEIATGLHEMMTQGGGRTAKVSPDGAFLYFTRIDERGLWRRPLESPGVPEKILDDPVPVDWNTWAVTENSIFYVRRRVPPEPELMRFDLDTETSEIVLAVPDLLHNSGLWVADDEQYLLLTRLEEAGADLVLLGEATQETP